MRFHTDRGTDTGRAIFENKGTWFGTANSCSFWGSTTKTSGEITFVVGTNYSIGGYFVDIDAAYNPRRLYYSASGNFNYINLSFDPIDGKVRHYMVIRKDLVFKVFVNGVLEGQNTLSQNRNLGVWSIGATDGGLAPIKGSVGDVLLWRTDIPAYAAPYLADPDNIDYRIGGVPLLLSPARKFWSIRFTVAKTFSVALVDASDRLSLKVNPTIEVGDVKISKNGGSLANLTYTPTPEPAGSAIVKVELTDSEMDAERIDIVFSDQTNPKEWADHHIHMQPLADLGVRGHVIADSANSTTSFKTSVTSSVTDFCKGQIIRFVSGNLKGQVRSVTAFDAATSFITVGEAFSEVPAGDDDFVILGKAN